jgi:hypothetical protein
MGAVGSNTSAAASPVGSDAVRPAAAWRRAWVWSLLVFLLLSGVTIWTAWSQWSAQHDALREQTDAAMARWGVTLQTAAPHLLSSLDQLRDWWRPRCTGPVEAFETAAEHTCGKDPALLFVGWVGVDGVCKAALPNRAHSGDPISDDPAWTDAWDRAHGDGRDIVGGPRVGNGPPEVRCVMPVFDGDAAPDKFRGAIIARIAIENFVRESLGGIDHEYRSEIRDGRAVLFQSNPENVAATTQTAEGRLRQSAASGPDRSAFTLAKHIPVPGRSWELRLTPTEAVVAQVIDSWVPACWCRC